MKIQNLFDKAKVNNWPYFFMAFKNSHTHFIFEKDNLLEYCLKKIAYSYCCVEIHQLKILLAINNVIFAPEERERHFYEVIARSFSKAFSRHIVMGIGQEKPFVYKFNREIGLKRNDINIILSTLIGHTSLQNDICRNKYIALQNEENLKIKKLFYHSVLSYGVDIIPLIILDKYLGSTLKVPWLETLLTKISNVQARGYLRMQERNKVSLSA